MFDIALDHAKCSTSTGIAADELTFGQGKLDFNGYWQFGCPMCAREHEAKFPENGPCWPYDDEVMQRLRQSLVKLSFTRIE